MGRRAKVDKPVDLHLRLPAPLVGELTLLLWSDAHGRVPLGQMSDFIEIAIREKIAAVRALITQSENQHD